MHSCLHLTYQTIRIIKNKLAYHVISFRVIMVRLTYVDEVYFIKLRKDVMTFIVSGLREESN